MLAALRFLSIIVLFVSLYFAVKIQSITYPDLINFILKKYSGTYYLDEWSTRYFTYPRYLNFRTILFLLPLLILAAIIFLWIAGKRIDSVLKKMAAGISDLCKSHFETLKGLTGDEKIITLILFLLIMATRIYLFRRYPFNGDEACSYFAFVKNGFLYTLSYYPTPNNHILYNLICIPFSYLFTDPLLVMRMPNLLIDFFLLLMVFVFLKRNFDFNTAFLAVVLTGMSYSCSIYAVHGRGYMLMSFLTLMAVFSFIKWIKARKKRMYAVIFVSSSILGGFTIPLFVLPCTALITFGLITTIWNKDIKMAKSVFIFSFFIIGGVVLLYLPVFLISGLNSIINNEFVQPFTDLIYYFFHIIPVASVEAIDFVLGTTRQGYLFLGIFLILFVIVYRRAESEFKKQWYVFIILSILSTYLIFIMQRTFGEFRMFTFYGFLFYITLSFMLMTFIDYLKKDWHKKMIISVIALFFTVLIPVTFDRKMKVFYGTNYLVDNQKMDAMISLIASTDPSAIYIRDKAFTLFLQYHNSTHPKKISLYINDNMEKADYDYIILEREEEFPVGVSRVKYRKADQPFQAILYKRVEGQ